MSTLSRSRGFLLLLLGLAAPASAASDSASRAEEETRAESSADSAAVELRRDEAGRWIAPTLEVRAERIDGQARLDELAPSASLLEMDDWSGGFQTAADVLRRSAGLNVRESGGLAGYGGVSLRGSTSEQVPVYLDGVPLQDPATGGVDLADLPMESLSGIEVYRGAAPLVLGTPSLGGAIHLRSQRGHLPSRLSLQTGSYGHLELSGAGSARRGAWVLSARGRVLRNEGNWEYLDDRGTLYNPDDDVRRERINNDVRGGGLHLSALRPVGTWSLHWTGVVDGREQGMPGYAVRPSEDARAASLTLHSRLALRPLSEKGHLRRIATYQRLDRQDFEDLDGDYGGGPSDRRDRVISTGLELHGAVDAEGRAPDLGLDLRWARLESRDEAATVENVRRPRRWSVAAAYQPRLHLPEKRLLLSPGLRLRRISDRLPDPSFGETLPTGPVSSSTRWATTVQLGTRLQLSPGLALRANLGRYERPPTLLELFGDRGSVVGNPDLEPERGVNRDLGVVWRPERRSTRFALTVFDNDAFDLITYEARSPVSAGPINVGRADLRGLEVEADFGRFGPFDLRLAVTRLWTRDRSGRQHADGKPLPARPGYTLQATQGVRVAGGRTELVLHAVGDNVLQTDGHRATRVPSRVRLGWNARVPVGPLEAWLRVENLTDDESFDLWNHPLPGRHFSFALRWGGQR